MLAEYESSPNRRKHFCSRCGSQLFIRGIDRRDITVVTMGHLGGCSREQAVPSCVHDIEGTVARPRRRFAWI
jgi:hypothetical protein